MSDIVERLRHCADNCGDDYLRELSGRAADEIERLRAALRPFAGIKADDGDDFSKWPDQVIIKCEASVREIKAARAALKEDGDE